jgi:nitrogenase-associated protein
MAQIVFYTKPDCTTAARQVELLRQSGHEVEVRDLLAHPWTAKELLSYFGELPVEACFNEKSPRVRSGEIDPTAYVRDAAIGLMLADHLLIHRPLMESGGTRCCGFDPAAVHAWVGLGTEVYRQCAAEDLNACSQSAASPQQCP